jgi:hypothetical protein
MPKSSSVRVPDFAKRAPSLGSNQSRLTRCVSASSIPHFGITSRRNHREVSGPERSLETCSPIKSSIRIVDTVGHKSATCLLLLGRQIAALNSRCKYL